MLIIHCHYKPSYKDLKGATSINIGHLLSKLKPQIKIVHILIKVPQVPKLRTFLYFYKNTFSLNDNCIYIQFFFSIRFMYAPVYDFLHFATSSGVPQATTVPPPEPPSGPISMM